ncbi:hypothetical protein P856_574 [Candidatus Endolissoclinum faulkneri L5]|uniref:Fe/B12 periplasmic-binding domain-containing protein n=1 Tax=Candidatus Endolissoclinum faulkneri L5 TaxID=1401328 RepID=V9TT81_9PROT|nr:ABC transporter substrate-binding protein [Candidatus Endolissoclinum faulkneri]AHC73786.1 hypothetical protein P856_574 [Candidatus Endolissoclinum faulkneri L5]
MKRLPIVLVAIISWTRPAASMLSATTVVSLDYCSDQYVLEIADQTQIRGVSHEASKPFSYHQKLAIGLPTIRPTAEAILAISPEIVVYSWAGNQYLVSILTRAGIKTINISNCQNYKTIFTNFTKVAEALNRPITSIITEQQSRISTLKSQPKLSMRALYITPSGTTGGIGSDIDAMIRLAGLENMAASLGYLGWRTIPIEQIITNPPDLYIVSFFNAHEVSLSYWSSTRNPYIARSMGEIKTVSIPSRFLSCNGMFSVKAAEYLRASLD